MTSGRTEVPYSSLIPTASNVRKVYTRIEELARSIAEHGLLQNLVVVALDGGTYEVRAGERRRRALELLHLPPEEQWKRFNGLLGCWPEQKPVPVLVIPEHEADIANLIENVQREELYPWEVGRRLAEWNDAGFEHHRIAEYVSKSRQWVSLMVSLGRYLSPQVTAAIERMGKCPFNTQQLSRIAQLYDPLLLEPLHEKQLEKFEAMLGEPKPRVRTTQTHVVMSRLKSLKNLAGVPGHAKPYVKAVVDYLTSEEKYARIKFNWD